MPRPAAEHPPKQELPYAVGRLDDLLERPEDCRPEIVEPDLVPELSKLSPHPGCDISDRARLEAQNGEPNLERNVRETVEELSLDSPEDGACAAEYRHGVRLQFSSSIAHRGPERQSAAVNPRAAAVLHREIKKVRAHLKCPSLTSGRVDIECCR